MRNGIAAGIRDVDGAGAGIDGGFDDAAEEVDLGAAGVFAGELHVLAEVARALDRADRLLHHLVRLHAQLVLHMDGAGGDERMDARGIGAHQCLGGAVDVGIHRPRQAAHGAVPDAVGDGLDRLEVAGAGDGEAGLDHVHPHAFQRLGDAQLLFLGHGGARALLAVAQGGIEDDDAIVAAHVSLLTAPPYVRPGSG
ncbi:hypothetical protein D3C76_1115030 [compost metagenome]